VTPQAIARADLLRKEALLAIPINAAVSAVFFLIVFGWSAVATTALAIDFLPQTMGMTALGIIVPSIVTLKKIAAGKVTPAGPRPTLGRLILIFPAAVVTATVVFGGIAALLLTGLANTVLTPWVAVALKAAYGGFVGFVMTPPILRVVLGMPVLPRRGRAPSAVR
jgi:hypothetical protein